MPDAPSWSSKTAKYSLIAGVVLFGIGIDPYAYWGGSTYLTPLVEQGPSIFGLHMVQIILAASGIVIASYGVLLERSRI